MAARRSVLIGEMEALQTAALDAAMNPSDEAKAEGYTFQKSDDAQFSLVYHAAIRMQLLGQLAEGELNVLKKFSLQMMMGPLAAAVVSALPPNVQLQTVTAYRDARDAAQAPDGTYKKPVHPTMVPAHDSKAFLRSLGLGD